MDTVLSEDASQTSHGLLDDGYGPNDGDVDGSGGDFGGFGASQEVGGSSGGGQPYDPWTMNKVIKRHKMKITDLTG